MLNPTDPKIFVIGGANLDISGNCDQRLRPGDSNPGQIKNSPGGVGRNIAENLARLGLNTKLISALGEDLGKEVILNNCLSSGIDPKELIIRPELATGTYLAINNQLGALIASIADMGIIDTLVPEILVTKRLQLSDADEIVIEANLPIDSIRWVCEEFPNKAIHADAVSAAKAPKFRQVLPFITVLKVNREEAMQILQVKDHDSGLAQRLFDKGVQQVLLSQGAEGCTLCNSDGLIRKSAIQGNSLSDTGAGDALISGFIAAQHIISEPSKQLEFAVACATMALGSTESVNPEISVQAIKNLIG